MMKTALTGVMSASRDLSVISNNLANAMTVGFKRSTAQYVDVMSNSQSDLPGVDIGQGTRDQVVRRSNSQGSLKTTGSVLDVALTGQGFFTYGEPGATTSDTALTYSRAGQLQITATGQLVDVNSGAPIMGVPVLSGGLVGATPQPINLTSATYGDLTKIQSISIDLKGVVNVTTTDGATKQVAAMAIARFPNEDGLVNKGSASLVATDESGLVEYGKAGQNGLGAVQQGTLEQSNVDMTAEMLRMIQAQQAYNGNSRALQTGSEMLRSTIETLTAR
jgi:flagellar hook protein FlgE